MTVSELEPHFRRHGEKIRAKLLAGRGRPVPSGGSRYPSRTGASVRSAYRR
jgi:hypothetical protein